MRLDELHLDWKAVTVIIVTTLVLSVARYHKVLSDSRLNKLFYYLAVPLFVIVVIFRESPAEYGFRLGDWKAGLVLTVVSILGITLFLPSVARLKDFRAYYSPAAKQVLPLLVETSAEMIGWEFFFRGFLLFALYRVVGPYAILLQAVPFALAHIGKPELETLSCIFGGSIFGYIAWRTNSFLYPFLIHTYMATMVVLLA